MSKNANNTGILQKSEWDSMLRAFPKMSLHDQWAISQVIRNRATAQAAKSGRAA